MISQMNAGCFQPTPVRKNHSDSEPLTHFRPTRFKPKVRPTFALTRTRRELQRLRTCWPSNADPVTQTR